MGLFYKLVFSNNIRFRIARHFLFWVIWISFYALVKTYQGVEMNQYNFWKTFPLFWVELLIQIPIDMAFCYTVLYFLLPKLFLKGRTIFFVFVWILLVFVAAATNHIYYFWAIPKFRAAVGLAFPYENISIFLGALLIMGSLNAEGGFAAAIKLGKLFFIKEKETELLHKEINRVNGGMTEQVDEVQPTFLFNVLNRLYALVQKEKVDATAGIKKINDLILYAGFDTKKTMLPLQRELDALKDYIELEKLSFNYEVDVKYQVTGNPSNKSIIPYLLIPLVENSFSCLTSNNTITPRILIEVSIRNEDFFIQIVSSKSSETSTLLGQKNDNVLNIEKRLQLRYPGAYNLVKRIEYDTLIIELKIDLSARLGI